MMKAERVLLTGATGFIGQALARRLIERGDTVLALVREQPGGLPPRQLPAGAVAVETDLRYAAGVARAVREADPSVVIHLAAVGVTDPFLPVGEALRGNLDATINLIKAVGGRARVLVARTPGEVDTINVYAAAKAAAWAFCKMFWRTEGWAIVGVMPFQVYGPGQSRKTLVSAAIGAARNGEEFLMTSGEQKRDWIYIGDVVNGILSAMVAPDIEGETIELGTGISTPVQEVVQAVFSIIGRGKPHFGALPQRPGEVPLQVANAAHAHRLTGWRAKVHLLDGLKQTIKWAENENPDGSFDGGKHE